jgi:PAS domain S-box-containing protein
MIERARRDGVLAVLAILLFLAVSTVGVQWANRRAEARLREEIDRELLLGALGARQILDREAGLTARRDAITRFAADAGFEEVTLATYRHGRLEIDLSTDPDDVQLDELRHAVGRAGPIFSTDEDGPSRLRVVCLPLPPTGGNAGVLAVAEDMSEPGRSLRETSSDALVTLVLVFASAIPVLLLFLLRTRRDATDLREAEKRIELDEVKQEEAVSALRRTEARFRSVFDAAFQMLGILRTDGEVVELNATALAATGIAESGAAGHLFWELPGWELSEEDRNLLRDAVARAARGETVHDEHEARGPAGRMRVAFSLKPLIDADGAIAFLVAEGRDVTDQHRAEKAAKEAHRMLRDVLDTIPVRVFWKDRESRYLGCNRLFALDAGHDEPEELLGQDDFAMCWRDQAEAYRADDRAVMESGKPRVDYEEPQTTPTGDRIWLRTSKLPLRDAEGRVVGVLGMYEDITAEKRAAEERRLLETKMTQAQKLESLGVLAGGIAHDFNNLLTGIVGNVELALAGLPPPAPRGRASRGSGPRRPGRRS